MLQWLNDLFNAFAEDLIAILPYSPFRQIIDEWTINVPDGIAWLNWFIDIPGMLKILAAWLTCYGIYLLVSIVMRWIKAIE